MKKTIILNFLIVATLLLQAAKPEWIKSELRKVKYSSERYFTGFSMAKKAKSETELNLLERLKEFASDELINSVLVTVESATSLEAVEINNEFFETFKHSSSSFSKIELAGLKTETFYDKSKKTGYAFAYVKKTDLIKYYSAKIKNLKNQIANNISEAEQYLEISDEENALKAFYKCMALFREADVAMTIILLLQAPEDEIKTINQYQLRVKKGIASIYGSDQLDLSEVCNFLVYGLKKQNGKLNNLIRLGTLTYQDTKMGSAFSRRFAKAFEKELIEEAGLIITTKASAPNQKPDNCKYLLNGTYWEEGENIRIIAILRDIETFKTIASAEGLLPIKWLDENKISYEPENFREACENMKIFKKNEITSGGMQLDVWTNKGNDSPIFEENDTLQFFIRANNECYVRIVNHFADGTKVLLVDNLYIGSDKVNKVVSIPRMFYCAPPFGTEILQANAQTEAFNPLRIESQQGYDIILGTLDEVIENTRGFKPLKNEDLQIEKRIIVSSLKKRKPVRF